MRAFFEKLCAVFGNCKIAEWAGFHGCDSQVLDGTGMSFKAVLADGTEVNANGTNSFPKNFQHLLKSFASYNNSKK